MVRTTKFEYGDLVYHRSNPTVPMVVNYVDEESNDDQKYECTWITVHGKHRCEEFDEIELEKVLSL